MSDETTGEEADASADGEADAEGEGVEEVEEVEEKQPTPPIELNLPPEVADALTTVMTALEEFGKAVQPFLDESHANAAEAAEAADPFIMPEGLAKVEETIAEWSGKVDGQIVPLEEYVARIRKERVPIDEYLAALKEVFKDAQPLPEPEEEKTE